MTTVAPCWRADPMTVGAARYWDGHDWTDLVSWGGQVCHDPTPLARVRSADARAERDALAERLHEAETRGVIGHEIVERLLADLADRPSEVVTPAAMARSQAGPPMWPSTAPAIRAPRTLPPPQTQTQPRPAPIVVEPGTIARWWARVRPAVASDLAVHGLAYLGVLLLFAGVFGLIAFSLGDVDPQLRLLPEVLAPAVCFTSAFVLGRRGARVVASALELVGAAVTPVVAIAWVTDGAPVPPDVTGRALPLVQGASCLAVAAAIAAVVRRRPASTARFVVAPAAWLGIGLASGAFRDTTVSGDEVIRPAAFQLAVIAAAVALTVSAIALAGRRRTDGPLSRATRLVAWPAVAVAVTAELGTALRQGLPVVSGVVAALALIVVLEVGAGRSPSRAVSTAITVGQATAVGLAAVRLCERGDDRWIAAGAIVVLLALAEWSAVRRPTATGIGVAVGGAGLALSYASIAPLASPAAVAAGVAATAWLSWRHVCPAASCPLDDPWGVAAGASTVVPAIGIARWLPIGTTELVLAGSVAAVAMAGRAVRVVRAQVLWRWWVPTASAAVITTALVATAFEAVTARTMVAVALAAAALVVAPAPRTRPTPWLVSGSLVAEAMLLPRLVDVDESWWYVGCAAMMLVLAGLAHGRRDDLSDAAAALAAFALAVAASVASVVDDRVAPVHLTLGALALVVAVVLRRREVAVVTAALWLAAGIALGDGWPALACLVDGAALSVAGLTDRRPTRLPLVTLGAVAAVGAWGSLAGWQDWTATTVVATTLPTTAGMVAVLATALRTHRGPGDVESVWAAVLTATTAATAVLITEPDVSRANGGTLLATAFAFLAVAAAQLAHRGGRAWRWVSGALAVASGTSVVVAASLGSGAVVAVSVAATASVSIWLTVLRGRRPTSTWVGPLALVDGLALVPGLVGAMTAHTRGPLIALLLAAAIETAVVGTVLRQTATLVASPVLACLAWLVFAVDALTGDPNWFTVPIGLALLLDAGALRWLRGGRAAEAGAIDGPDVLVLEWSGMTALVVSALVETMTGELAYALLAMSIGVGVVVWAMVSRVRRRLLGGVAMVVLAVALLLIVPFALELPTMSGPALWVTVGGVGLVAIAVAASLERGRATLRRLREAFHELTEGWE